MTHKVSSVEELNYIATELVVEDVIVHKPLEYATVVFELQRTFPDILVMAVHPGTDVYTEHGYNTSVIIGGLSPA